MSSIENRFEQIVEDIQQIQDDPFAWRSLDPITTVNLNHVKEELTKFIEEGNFQEGYILPYYDLSRVKKFSGEFIFNELRLELNDSFHTQVWKDLVNQNVK